MRLLRWIRLIGIGGFAGGSLSAMALWIDTLIRPERNIMMFDLTLLVYLFVGVVGFIGGSILAIVQLAFQSRSVTLVSAAVVSLTVSWGMIKGAAELYQNPTYFDAPMFYSDIAHILLNLLIFPVVGFVVWKLADPRAARSME